MRHAYLKPSSAHRWMACPGSVEMEAACPDRGSEYAEQGSTCHRLLADELTGTDTENFKAVTLLLEGGAERVVEVTPSMHRWVREAAEWVRMYTAARTGARLSSEEKSPVGTFYKLPDSRLSGHADVVVRAGDELTVVDAKFGHEEVQAERNSQLSLYALGLAAKEKWRYRRYNLVVLQPRVADPVKVESLSADELRNRGRLYEPDVRAALSPDAPLIPGDHCSGCRAAGTCRAYQERAQELGRAAFAAAGRTLAPEELALVLDRAAEVRRALDAAERAAMAMLALGQVVPGWKRVSAQGRRRWTDEAEAEKLMRALGLDPWRRSILSPNQAEEELGSRGGLLTALAPKVPGQPTLAPESDKRPALPPDFKKEKGEGP